MAVVVVALVIPLSFFYQFFNHRAQVRTCALLLVMIVCHQQKLLGKDLLSPLFSFLLHICRHVFSVSKSSFLAFSHSFSLPTLTRSASRCVLSVQDHQSFWGSNNCCCMTIRFSLHLYSPDIIISSVYVSNRKSTGEFYDAQNRQCVLNATHTGWQMRCADKRKKAVRQSDRLYSSYRVRTEFASCTEVWCVLSWSTTTLLMKLFVWLFPVVFLQLERYLFELMVSGSFLFSVRPDTRLTHQFVIQCTSFCFSLSLSVTASMSAWMSAFIEREGK